MRLSHPKLDDYRPASDPAWVMPPIGGLVDVDKWRGQGFNFSIKHEIVLRTAFMAIYLFFYTAIMHQNYKMYTSLYIWRKTQHLKMRCLRAEKYREKNCWKYTFFLGHPLRYMSVRGHICHEACLNRNVHFVTFCKAVSWLPSIRSSIALYWST